jgi:O-antigen/teichoic acid export membrane protein
MVLLIIILAALLLAAGIPFFASLVVPVIAALVVYMPDMPLSIVFHKMFNGVERKSLFGVQWHVGSLILCSV